jgi:hypothetical protein
MPDERIDVRVKESDAGWTAIVVVEGRGTKTEHRVTVRRVSYETLAGGDASPEELVRASFLFLLEREPKDSILSAFDIDVIARYFPEYPQAIAAYFKPTD